MTLVTEAPGTTVRSDVSRSSPWVLASVLPLAMAVIALLAPPEPSASEVVRALLVAIWALAGAWLCHHRQLPLGPLVVTIGTLAGLAAAAVSLSAHRDLDGATSFVVDAIARVGSALLPAAALHLLLALPDGALGSPGRRQVAMTGWIAGGAVGLALLGERDEILGWPLVLLWLAALAAGMIAANARYRRATAIDRRRVQWVGWAMAVVAEVGLVLIALRALTDAPQDPWPWALAATGLIPVALVAGAHPRAVTRVDRLLTATVSLAGLTALVIAVYAAVVIGLARTPEDGEQRLLLLSMAAAAVAALAWLPARRWLSETANRLVYGERVSPDEALRTWGSRLTRAIPLDELLLQLCESLRKSMALASAEIWTGQEGHYEWAAGVPHRKPAVLEIGPKERSVVARAGVSGGTWMQIWLPQLLGGHRATAFRIAPLAHQGALLGLIVCRRSPGSEEYTEEDDRVLTELARQVALALHNVQLDSALQASLEELRQANDELRASRARIVAAGDAERRKLERNLHDGAQQHLVALAVKLRLAKDMVEDDTHGAEEMLDEIRGDLQDAIQELRALAHGIFPPLLVSGGLGEALSAAASRSATPVTVVADGLSRHPAEVEAAVYFCCLEALQNASKHAGDSASVRVRVWEGDAALGFEVTDDGAGFDPAGAHEGHGFINMADRLGAFGGRLTVQSAPGRGTTITGTIPLQAPAGEPD
jgi:signal transduction histidine kinase